MSRQLDSTGLKRLHRTWRRRTSGRVALLLDRLQSPFNVGSILRTAAAYSVDHLWLVDATVARRRQDGQDGARAPAASSTGPGATPPRRPTPPPGPTPTASWRSS